MPAASPEKLLEKLSRERPEPEVRSRIYQIAARLKYEGLLEAARRDAGGPSAAVAYLLAVSPGRAALAARWLGDQSNPAMARATLEALRADRDLARQLIDREWIDRRMADGNGSTCPRAPEGGNESD